MTLTGPDASRAGALLADAVVAWMTTVRPDGQPQASPVWFVIDDGEFLIYSANSARLDNLAANPLVALNLDSNAGEDVLTVEGIAQVVEGPTNLDNPAYQEKYGARIDSMGMTREEFSDTYSTPIRVTPTRWRLF